MRLRESLPARVALVTTALLALVLVITTTASYVMTALMLRQAVDRTLAVALPMSAAGLHELAEARRFAEQDPEHRLWQVIDLRGRVLTGEGRLPVDRHALQEAVRRGVAFTSVVVDDDRAYPRRGPGWWLALTPQEDEYRVVYARALNHGEPVIFQLGVPLGPEGEVLPHLQVGLLGLAVAGALLCGAIAWAMAGRVYRPLRTITQIASAITTQTLATRIPETDPDSTLRQLTAVLNGMIGRLQEAFEAQGRFVAAAAHELRGPLAAMRAELEVALRRERTPEEYREALAGALEDATRLSAIAEHLLILARYERGTGLAFEADLPLAPLLERVAEEVRRSAGGEVITVAPPDLAVDGDPVALERMVANLARNGIQAGGSPVRIAAWEEGGGVRIEVTDQGPGIPPEALPHIFEPFYRADPARGRDGGTGLGLAIVRSVVEAHQGRVEVESSPGAGTTFRIWLPRRQSRR